MIREPSSRLQHAAVFCILVAATIGWTMYAGKDASWDLFNHHLYVPFSATSGRHATDFFAAGPQSYQSPLGYVPGYLMISVWRWPDWVIGSVLAAVHAACAFIVYGLALRLWAGDPRRRHWSAIAAALAWSAPTFLLLAGTTSTDPTTALLALGGLSLAVGRDPPSWRPMLLAGALAGLAFAIKQSNAVFAIAIGAVVVVRAVGTDGSLTRAVISYSAGVLGAAVAGLGWWAANLWSQFGNPIFPLFNNIFKSPFASTQPILANRFVPTELWGYLSRFWEIARPKEFIWIELSNPDIRPLALLIATACLIAVTAFRAISRREVSAGRAFESLGRRKLDLQLIAFALVSYVLWLKTSGNARYALPLLMVAGLLLVRTATMALHVKVARICLAVVAVLQFGYFLDAGGHRYAPHAWTGRPYIEVHVPRKLIEEPFLHLSLGLQTHAVLAPYLHAGGAMMNPVGQASLPTDGVVGERVQRLMSKWKGRTRVLAPRPSPDPVKAEMSKALIGNLLYRLKIGVDWNDCLPISIDSGPEQGADVTRTAGAWSGHARTLRSCATVPLDRVDAEFEAQRPVIDRVFQAIEASCPLIFGPPGMVSEWGVGKWQRFYANTDAIVTASMTDGVSVTHGRTNIDRSLGSVEEILAGKSPFKCVMWSLLAAD